MDANPYEANQFAFGRNIIMQAFLPTELADWVWAWNDVRSTQMTTTYN